MKKFYYILFLLLPMLAWVGCTDEEVLDAGENQFVLNYTVRMADDVQSRAVGDGSHVDELIVVAYEMNGEEYTEVRRFVGDKNEDSNSFTVDIALFKNRSYYLLFWAQNSATEAYTLGESGIISVDYTDCADKGFSGTNELDAFYATSTVKFTDEPETPDPVTLHRPFAQLNFADKATRPEQGMHQAVVTYRNLSKSFNPFSGEVVEKDENEVTFTFTDFPDETLDANGESYYYVASNYFFASANDETTIEAVLDWQHADGTSINVFVFKDDKAIALEQNKRTNVLGTIVQQPQVWSVWDGNIPTVSTLTTDPENQNRYIIDEANDVAWLSVEANAQSLVANSTFIMTVDVDMNNGSDLASIHFPTGSTLDGDGHTIKGLKLENALLGDVTDITVKNLNIEETVIENNTSSEVTHVGVLVNTLKGSNTFSNIHIKNSSVSTKNGAAGGIIGYISRKDPNNQEEELTVIFDDCHVTETTVEGSHSEGHFVGLLRGYDNNETLQFNSNCTLTFSATARSANEFVSPYREGNESTWLADNDYSKYDGWLGNEECYRGTVMYGENRFIPRWNGETQVTPLTDGTTKLIYSAFDLANCAGTNPGTIKFMENIDMGAKIFNPLTDISKLFGEGKTIYNLKVETKYDTQNANGGGFIRRCTTSTIENITFNNADVKVTHVEGSEGDALASIVCGTAEGNNTMTNVKVVGGKLYGCNKMGGLAGYITGTFNATNCSVDGLSIENYDSGGKDKLGFKANGEVGGAFGFIAANSTISGCYVKNTTLNCVGVNNGRVLVLFKYAGRHVNEFIGDIRTTSGQTIRITLDEDEFTGNSYKNRKDQYSGCKYIGHCYYTSINAVIAKIEDTKGTVYVNDKSITVAKNY